MGTNSTKIKSSEAYTSLGLVGSDEIYPQIISIMASVLEKSVQKNEKLSKSLRRKESVTVFHGLRAPTLSIRQYIERIHRYANCSPSCFVIAFVYMDRYAQRTDSHLTSLNVHRLLITSVMLAAKFVDDACYSNAYFAKVGGVSTAEINELEMEFLSTLDFRLHVTVEEFDQYCLRLERDASGSFQIQQAVGACGRKGSWPITDEPRSSPEISGYTCRAI
ncbi:hypothetical protein Nepgr_001556 [Nepenthes gracilis]|uniref:Cyclin-like domain-containing protein n=1 Tax=Nepenthes gracilis TaxID=150966 RepID=A0AAD3RW55_NEPGR|nr:hypothetical protein Nepgr_001556 [Nepenthes gracilis]